MFYPVALLPSDLLAVSSGGPQRTRVGLLDLSGLVQSSPFTDRETKAHGEAWIFPRSPGRHPLS